LDTHAKLGRMNESNVPVLPARNSVHVCAAHMPHVTKAEAGASRKIQSACPQIDPANGRNYRAVHAPCCIDVGHCHAGNKPGFVTEILGVSAPDRFL